MTGYNIAHGDTEAVRLDLMNIREARETMLDIITGAAHWDGERWVGVESAAQKLRHYVDTLDTKREGFDEIRDADLDNVDWDGIVISDLREINAEAGRGFDDGIIEQ